MKNKYFYNKEKSTSLKRLKDEKKVVNEDNLSGGGNAHPWEEISKISVKIVEGEPVRLGGTGLFKTGSSVVDTNSVQYKDADNILNGMRKTKASTEEQSV